MNTKPKLADPVHGVGPLTRPLYRPGLLLQDDDLTAAVQYTRDLNRLMFRTLFGCGVMCGLVVDPKMDCCKLHIHVSKGVALDCHGDPIDVALDQDIVIDPVCVPVELKTLWIMLRGWEKNCAPRTPVCPDDGEEVAAVCTRARDGYEIKVVQELPPCTCSCVLTEAAKKAARKTSPASPANITTVLAKTKPPRPHISAQQTEEIATAFSLSHRNPVPDCYSDHYAGKCNCECCDSEWIVLASIAPVTPSKGSTANEQFWSVDHSVRRFVRPVLMRDPMPAQDAIRNAPSTSP